MTDAMIRQDTTYKSDDVFSEKRMKNQAGFPFVCTCGSNTRINFYIETRKIQPDIAEIMTVHDIHDFACFRYGIVLLLYLLYQHLSIVGKTTNMFYFLRFRGYLGEIGSDSPSVWTCVLLCTIVPRPVLPMFKS